MYSVQRRHKRYKILYLYKIKENLVPNISDNYPIQFCLSGRQGWICKVLSFPLYQNKAVTARNSSFVLTSSSLWNALPKSIRNLSGLSVESFKKKLDKILKNFPDIPHCSASGVYADICGCASNSLQDISRNLDFRRRVMANT